MYCHKKLGCCALQAVYFIPWEEIWNTAFRMQNPILPFIGYEILHAFNNFNYFMMSFDFTKYSKESFFHNAFVIFVKRERLNIFIDFLGVVQSWISSLRWSPTVMRSQPRTNWQPHGAFTIQLTQNGTLRSWKLPNFPWKCFPL